MEIKEMRQHIKPYLRYALKLYKEWLKIEKSNGWASQSDGLCCIAEWYTRDKNLPNKVHEYIQERLNFVRPKDTKYSTLYWWDFNKEGLQKRINFCKQQLKIVKP